MQMSRTRKHYDLPTIKVGDGGFISIGSDRYPITVVDVQASRRLVAVQRDNYVVVKGSVLDGSAEYVYTRNHDAGVDVFRWNVRLEKFQRVRFNASSNRWVKAGSGSWNNLHVGIRRAYRDPHV